MAAPILVSVGDLPPQYEGRCVVEYLDLEGGVGGSLIADTLVITGGLFGKFAPLGPRPFIWACPSASAAAGVTVAVTGTGQAGTPWVVTLTTVANLAAGQRTGRPLKVVFLPGAH